MKKTTRKSFSRKAIIIIASVFLVISLTATGFAAWLISNGSGDNVNGNVTVSTVTDASLKVTISNKDNLGTIKFGPQKNDNDGNVRYDSSDANDFENLSVKLEGSVENYKSLDKMYISVKCPDSILAAAGYEWGDAAVGSRTYTYNAKKAYIALPAYAMDSEGKDLPLPSGSGRTARVALEENKYTGSEENKRNFSYTVEFGWGALFDSENPGVYLDKYFGKEGTLTNEADLLEIANEKISETANQYKTLTAEAKSVILTKMKTVIAESTNPTYVIVLEAEAK